MTEDELLEQELEPLLVGKFVRVRYMDPYKGRQVVGGIVDRLAVDTVTQQKHVLILFLCEKRIEVPLDDLITNLTLLN